MSANPDEINERLFKIEAELSSVKERNQRVELEKAWETSRTRILSIGVLTYALMSLVFYLLAVDKFLLNAVVPTLGFVLSTQSLPIIKQVWLSLQSENKNKSKT